MARISERIEVVRTIYSDQCVIRLERSNSNGGEAKLIVKDHGSKTEAAANLDSDTINKLITSLANFREGETLSSRPFSPLS